MSLHAIGDSKSLTLNLSQEIFLYNWDRFLGFFGGVGNGKTTIGVIKVIEICKTFPKSRGVIARKTWPALEATTMEEFFDLCPPELLDMRKTRRSAGSPQAKFKNGSTVLFRHLQASGADKKSVFQRLSNLNLNFVLVDQAEEIQEEWFNLFRSRLRRVVFDDKGRRCPAQLMLTGNMAGRNWIYKKFKVQQLENHKLIEASTLENRDNLPPEYVNDLLTSPERWRARYVFGSWDDYEGLIFNEFKSHTHEIEPFEIPASWRKFRVVDHGIANPGAVTWWAVNSEGDCFLYKEYYKGGLIIKYHVENIMRMSFVDYPNIFTYYDPSVMYKTNQEEKRGFYSDYDEYVAQGNAFANANPEFKDMGMWGYPANNNLSAGIGMVNEYATVDPEHINPLTRELGSPRVFIFKGMESWWAEQGDYTWLDKTGVDIVQGSAVHAEVEDPTKPNHLMDTTRYFFMSRPKVSLLRAQLPQKKEQDAWRREWKKPKKSVSWKTK